MKRLISAKLAANVLLISLGFLLIFHLLVLFRLLPSTTVWGGQAVVSPRDLIGLELVAFVVTLLFTAIIAAKASYIPVGRFKMIATIGVWLVFAYLLLTTLGSLASGITVEKLIFAPITIVLALCAFRLTME